MIRLVAAILIVWVAFVVMMQHGGPSHVLAELTLPHVVR